MKIKLIGILMILSSLGLSAQKTFDFTQLGANGISITDSTYAIGYGGTAVKYAGKYVFTGTCSSFSGGYIEIHDGTSYCDSAFTLSNLNLSGGNDFMYPFSVTDPLNYKIILDGTNTVSCGWALYIQNCSITLEGDSLTITSKNVPSIGGKKSDRSGIIINSGYINATYAGAEGYPAIGGGDASCDSIVINGGVVTATATKGNAMQANLIRINGGSVKATMSQTAVNSNGESVYCVTVPHNDQYKIMVDDGTIQTGYEFIAHHPNDDNYYLYLPDGEYTFTSGDLIYEATVNGAAVTATVVVPENVTIDVSIIDGHVNIYDGYYTIGNTSTDYKGSYLFTGSTTNEYYIKINPGDYADTTFTFKDIAMNSGSGNGGMLLMQTKVMLNFVGSNHIESERGLFQNTDTLTILGDSLEAIANNYCSAIGPASLAGSIIELNNKYLYAFTTSTLDPAIGAEGTKCDSIVIKGTTTTAISGCSCDIRAKHICINGGSVKGTLSQTAVNTNGDSVYCVVVPHNGKLSIGLNDGIKDSTLTFFAHHPADDNFYIYLPNGSYSFSNGDGNTYTAIVNGANTIATGPAIPGDGIIEVSQGKAVIINDTAYYIGAQPYIYKGHKFVFTGKSTTGSIKVFSKLADTLTFRNLSIEMEAGCAFSLRTGNDITIALEGTNTLKSTGTFAGLEKDSTAGVLTICGPDTLIASGGIGIGNCWTRGSVGCGNITIEDGVITATGSYASIGGSPSVKAGVITINGGNIMAICTGSPFSGDAAIGNASAITINKGTINIKPGNNPAFYNKAPVIKGGIISIKNNMNGEIIFIKDNGVTSLPSGITISGGTVNVGNTNGASTFRKGTFTGGSINLLGGNDGQVVISNQPVDADSNVLYRSLYIVPEITEPTLIDSIIINDTLSWGCNDVYTDSTGILYLWVPKADTAIVKIYVDGKSYFYSGKVINYNNYVAPNEDEGILEYGNCLWQVPVNIASENGMLRVSNGGTPVNNGDYFCYKTELPLSISTSPDDGYKLDGITVYGIKTSGDTVITVTDTVRIAGYFSDISSGINNITDENIWVYSHNKILHVHSGKNAEISVHSISGRLVNRQQAVTGTAAIPVPQSGMYILKITEGQGKVSFFKCIVQ